MPNSAATQADPLTIDAIEDAIQNSSHTGRTWRHPKREELRVYGSGTYVTIEIDAEDNAAELSRGTGKHKASRTQEVECERALKAAGINYR